MTKKDGRNEKMKQIDLVHLDQKTPLCFFMPKMTHTVRMTGIH